MRLWYGGDALYLTPSGNLTTFGKVTTAAGTTGAASLNLPPGTAPTSPVNGDIWTTSAGLFARVNGSTINLAKFELEVAASDETTALTTGTAKITFYMPAAVTLTEVFIGLGTQSSGGAVTAVVNKAGATIFSTNPSVGASQDTSLSGTGSVQAVLSTTSFAKGDKMTVDISAAGTGAKGLKITLIGSYT